MNFRSKVDAWVWLVLLIVIAPEFWVALQLFASGNAVPWIVLALLLIVPVLLLWIFTTTYYVVSDTELLVRCGPLRIRIPLSQISGIQKTRNPLSSPALSLDRLAISYGRGKSCMISPKDQTGFLEALRVRGVRAA
jgi:Bacterial PH domain